jgi:hypothetical protein
VLGLNEGRDRNAAAFATGDDRRSRAAALEIDIRSGARERIVLRAYIRGGTAYTVTILERR